MVNRAYVGNLPFTFTAADLQQLFGSFGSVKGAEIVMDRMTGRSRGFGFVEMESEEQLKAAMAGLDGKSVDGRNLTVNEARERAPRPPGSGPRPGGGYGGGGGGGGGYAPRGGPGARPGGGGPRPGGYGGPPGGGYSGGGGGQRRGGGRGSDRPERSDRLERPEKGREDRWRYTRGGDDEE
jgi:RNA recognition motif-containing protein